MMSIQKIGAVVVSGLFLVATPAFAVTNDYVHNWAFDDAGGRSVSDSGGQNGVMSGSSTGLGWAGGKSGTALGMDGSDGTGVAVPDGFLKGSQGSLSVWFKFADFSDRNILFSGKSISDNNVFALLGIDYQGRPQFIFRTDPNGSNRKVEGGAVLNKNEWYHLVLVATGQSYQIYINGEQKIVSGENIGRWFPDFTNQVFSYRIGTSLANPLLGSFNGMIDELRLYNRPLTQDDVSALYNEGNNGTPTLPLALRPKTVTPDVEPVATPGASMPSVPVTEVLVGTPNPVSAFARNLAVGARGEDVKTIQGILISKGFLGAGLASGFFGPMTRDALAKYQASVGLPATGYFGAMTRAQMGNGNSSAQTMTTPSTPAPGGASVDPKIATLLELIATLQKQLATLKASGAQ